MAGDNLLYDIYERRLAARIDPATVPHHVGVILDGNRRWAKSMGFGAAQGHKRGADKIEEFLGWAEQMGVQVVTLWPRGRRRPAARAAGRAPARRRRPLPTDERGGL